MAKNIMMHMWHKDFTFESYNFKAVGNIRGWLSTRHWEWPKISGGMLTGSSILALLNLNYAIIKVNIA